MQGAVGEVQELVGLVGQLLVGAGLRIAACDEQERVCLAQEHAGAVLTSARGRFKRTMSSMVAGQDCKHWWHACSQLLDHLQCTGVECNQAQQKLVGQDCLSGQPVDKLYLGG
jgi:hypothetical protein